MRRHLLILFELFPSLSDGGAHGLELVVGVDDGRRGLSQVLHSFGRPLHRRRQLPAEKGEFSNLACFVVRLQY